MRWARGHHRAIPSVKENSDVSLHSMLYCVLVWRACTPPGNCVHRHTLHLPLTADAASLFFSFNNIHSPAISLLTNGMTVNAVSPIHPHFLAKMNLTDESNDENATPTKKNVLFPPSLNARSGVICVRSRRSFLSLSLSLSLQSSSGPECLVSTLSLSSSSYFLPLLSPLQLLIDMQLVDTHKTQRSLLVPLRLSPPMHTRASVTTNTLLHRARKRNCLVICLTRVAYNRNKESRRVCVSDEMKNEWQSR